MSSRTTHTYAILDLSPEAYQEIRAKLLEAGHEHAIEGDEAGEVIDMHGIAISEEEPGDVNED